MIIQYPAEKGLQEAAMEAKEAQKRDQSAPEDTESRIIEAEQTEIAVWESLLEIRIA
jgi:hypothetical protein